ncbi:MAG: zinc ABC transporter substrate-binding protein [Saprospiraceae bacterium]
MSYILVFVLFCTLTIQLSYSQKINVIATASMWADMAKVIGGDMIDVSSIVPVGSDPHLYEPTPSDIGKIKSADLIFINGLTFESWLTKLINNISEEKKIVLLTKNIAPITSTEHKGATDPHAWMDVENGISYALEICKALQKIDPFHEREFQFNFDIYKKQLEELHIYIKSRFDLIPKNKKVLITSHDAFQYFGRKYGLEIFSLLGVSTDADVQTNDLIKINEIIRLRNIPAIFIESTINPKIMQGIRSENNVKIGGKLYADSIGDENSEASTYLKMMKYNTDIISNALSNSSSDDTRNNMQSKSRWIIPFLISFYICAFIALYLINRK